MAACLAGGLWVRFLLPSDGSVTNVEQDADSGAWIANSLSQATAGKRTSMTADDDLICGKFTRVFDRSPNMTRLSSSARSASYNVTFFLGPANSYTRLLELSFG